MGSLGWLTATFEMLSDLEAKLGPGPARQLQVFREAIGRPWICRSSRKNWPDFLIDGIATRRNPAYGNNPD